MIHHPWTAKQNRIQRWLLLSPSTPRIIECVTLPHILWEIPPKEWQWVSFKHVGTLYKLLNVPHYVSSGNPIRRRFLVWLQSTTHTVKLIPYLWSYFLFHVDSPQSRGLTHHSMAGDALPVQIWKIRSGVWFSTETHLCLLTMTLLFWSFLFCSDLIWSDKYHTHIFISVNIHL